MDAIVPLSCSACYSCSCWRTFLLWFLFTGSYLFDWVRFVSSNSVIVFTLELASYNLLLASSLYSLQAGRETVWPHDPHTGWSYCVTIPSWVVRPKSRDSDPIVVFKLLIYAKCLIFISCYLLEDTFNIPKELLLPFCVVP